MADRAPPKEAAAAAAAVGVMVSHLGWCCMTAASDGSRRQERWRLVLESRVALSRTVESWRVSMAEMSLGGGSEDKSLAALFAAKPKPKSKGAASLAAKPDSQA